MTPPTPKEIRDLFAEQFGEHIPTDEELAATPSPAVEVSRSQIIDPQADCGQDDCGIQGLED